MLSLRAASGSYDHTPMLAKSAGGLLRASIVANSILEHAFCLTRACLEKEKKLSDTCGAFSRSPLVGKAKR